MPRVANLIFAGVVGVAVTMIAVSVNRMGQRARSHMTRDAVTQIAPHADVPGSTFPAADRPDRAASSAVRHRVIIAQPSGPPRIELAGVDPQGRSGSVACSTCHAVRPPDPENTSPRTLDEFHLGMTFDHGNVACYACHNPDDADSLRLADGTSVAYRDVMTLCSQCHSKQAESFAHGAHGGMNGHWDLTRGPQMKNNCIDCHDPHAPSYPRMIVDFKPKDRFNVPAASDHSHAGPEPHDNH